MHGARASSRAARAREGDPDELRGTRDDPEEFLHEQSALERKARLGGRSLNGARCGPVPNATSQIAPQRDNLSRNAGRPTSSFTWAARRCPMASPMAELTTQAADTGPTGVDAARLGSSLRATRHHAAKFHEAFSADRGARDEINQARIHLASRIARRRQLAEFRNVPAAGAYDGSEERNGKAHGERRIRQVDGIIDACASFRS